MLPIWLFELPEGFGALTALCILVGGMLAAFSMILLSYLVFDYRQLTGRDSWQCEETLYPWEKPEISGIQEELKQYLVLFLVGLLLIVFGVLCIPFAIGILVLWILWEMCKVIIDALRFSREEHG